MKTISTLCVLLLLNLVSKNIYAQDLAGLKSKKPLIINGTLDLRAISYKANGIANRRSPFSYIITGSPTLSLYGLSIPISFTYSEQERSFRQPFNQFGLSPTFKQLTLHGGYRNLSFSPYTLAGHTMLGAGIEFKPRKFSFALMTGRLNRATSIDTTTGVVQPLSFSRHGTAVKLGIGTDKSFFNISLLSAKDSEKGFQGKIDSSTVRPASNTVISTDFKLDFTKNIYAFGDAGLSIYTHDFTSSLEIDTSITLIKTMQKFMKLNASSKYYVAYSGGVGFKQNNYGLSLAYKYVDPNFISMGAYYIQNDLQSISLSPYFNLLKGKFRLNGSVGIQEDNQKRLKEAQTKRMISMANLSWDITEKLGIDANYSNFTTNSQPTVTLVDNKFMLAQTNSNLMISPRLILANKQATQVILLSYNQSKLKDLNPDTQKDSDFLSSIALLNYNITFTPIQLSLVSGINYTVNKLAMGEISNKGVSLGASKSFLKNKLATSITSSFIQSSQPAGKGNMINTGLNLSFIPAKIHRFSLRATSLKNSTTKTENTEKISFSELTAELAYTLNF